MSGDIDSILIEDTNLNRPERRWMRDETQDAVWVSRGGSREKKISHSQVRNPKEILELSFEVKKGKRT